MRRILVVFALGLALWFANGAVAYGQSSMTDAQILEYISQEQLKGSSQEQIAIKLMQKGVDVSRLQAVRKKYEKMAGSGSNLGARDLVNSTTDRTRMSESARKQMTQSTSGLNAGSGLSASGLNASNIGQLSSAQIQQLAGSRWQTSLGTQQLGNLNPRTTELAKMKKELSALAPDTLERARREGYEDLRARRVYGRDIFNNEYLTFEPPMNIATPDDYVLGAGDLVFVDVYGANNLAIEATVTPDGDIIIDGYGPVRVGGMTVSGANAKLRRTLGQNYANSNVRLTVGQTRTIMINVMGEVKSPVSYTVSPFATVSHALYMAGGPNEMGTLRDIKVYRGDELISTVDIYDYMMRGKLSGNVRLQDNDLIIVGPYSSLVNISGRVKRPMWYEMRDGESMEDVLNFAGGWAGDAYKNTVRLVRSSGQRAIYNIEAERLAQFKVLDEDSLRVDSIVMRWQNMVELRGAVRRPGMYQIGGRVTSVRQLIEMADGLDEMALADHVLLHRRKADRTIEAISFDLNALLNLDREDIDLQNEDVLFIPSKADMIEAQEVTILGEVFYPGTYEYAEGTTLYDLVVMAGGSTPQGLGAQITLVSKDGAAKQFASLDECKTESIKPFDKLFIGRSSAFVDQVTVVAEGEINARGTVALPAKAARLTDLISMAGGTTDDAWLKGAHVIRRMDPEEKARREQHMRTLRVYNAEVISSTNMNVTQQRKDLVDSLLVANYVNAQEYIVGIELEKALKNPDSEYNITLRHGDRLVIPQYENTVHVNGEVNLPNSMTYKKGKKAKWYINHAGGYTGTAWKHHAYVLHANGTVEKVGRGHSVDPGSEILVPVRPLKTSTNWSAFTSAFTSLGTVAALLITALN